MQKKNNKEEVRNNWVGFPKSSITLGNLCVLCLCKDMRCYDE